MSKQSMERPSASAKLNSALEQALYGYASTEKNYAKNEPLQSMHGINHDREVCTCTDTADAMCDSRPAGPTWERGNVLLRRGHDH